MFYGNLQNLAISSKSVIKSSSVISLQIDVMSDQSRVSLYVVMSQKTSQKVKTVSNNKKELKYISEIYMILHHYMCTHYYAPFLAI